MAANAETSAQPYFPLAQEREFFKYLPHDTSPSSSFNFARWRHECQPSRDTALVSFAQLGAFRLGAQRALISLFDRAHQHVLAEATPTLSLVGGHVRDDRDLLRLGCCSFPKDRGLCHLVSGLPSLEHDQVRWVMNGSAVVVPDVMEEWFECPHLLDELSDVRFYAAVPIISPRGFVIGAYSIWDDMPRPEGIDEHSLQFLKDMASTVMGHLVKEREYHNSQQAERMIVGLGSFVEGRATLRHSWREASAQYAASELSGEMVEGQLNMEQQDLQEAAKGTDQKTLAYRDPRRGGDGVNQGTVSHGPDKSLQNPKSSRGVPDGDEGPQEGVLLSSIKLVFSRAANLIRESIGAEGVMFFDPNSEKFGHLVNNTSRKVTGSVKDAGSSDEETDSSSSSSRRQPSSASEGENGKLHGPSTCVCLGSSTSRLSSINSNSTADSKITVEKSLLTSLLRRYPRGKIFSYNANRAVSDDSDCISQATSGSEKSSPEDNARRTKKRRPASKRRGKHSFIQDAEHLIKIFPDARNIMVLPVWDTDKNRCFAVNLVWTNSPERVFTAENELVYISVFANSIMMEIRRLDAKIANKAKTNLVSSITHELRNPLHGILGTSDILSDTAMNALQHGMVHTIEACGRTLLDTINNLLDFTFIDKYQKKRSPFGARQRATQRQSLEASREADGSRGEKPSYSQVELDQVVEEVTECVFAGYSFYNHPQTPPPALTDSSSRAAGDASSKRAGAEANRVTIIFDVDKDAEWSFYTHSGAWRRILMNTFGNALKYTPSGFIHLGLKSSRKEKEKKKRSGPDSEGEAEEYEVTLTVSDTGKGIGPEYLQKDLFTPFRQEDALASGSGLGLSIVRQAVGSLGGSIEVNSTQGVGTTMTIRTPLTHHPAPSSDASVFQSLRSHVEGKSMGLLGFGSSLHSKRDSTLYSSLERLCREWFGLSVTTVSPMQGQHQPYDFYLAVQTELDNEDREGRNLFNLGQHLAGDDGGSPVVVICQSPEEAHNMFIAAKNRGNESPIFEFISQPCGPRKLARALDLCIKRRLEQQAGQSSSTEEPTRWVEMPESSHLPLNLNPSDPPDERMKISKRPTTDTMGNGSRSREGGDGTDPSSHVEEGTEEHTTGKSVLLVDDNDLNLQLLSVYTKKSGYDYLTAKNGVEAVETYKAQPGRFGVVVIDLSMPVMDGFEAARQIRRIEKQHKHQSNSARPMIIAALTGLDSTDAQKEAFGSGIDTFLIKPVKRPGLQALLRQMDE
ncbi:hypothetical protein SI65_03377 [Aspergillus cristatus]|uniref:histidine kinase n=1 Tax=Aspergillus cristatus TaxID=573508 RepID=A0A1E3BHA2_ASPCR|nr:hypothetical protein SI65_03377 [Aspergillus cristatus]